MVTREMFTSSNEHLNEMFAGLHYRITVFYCNIEGENFLLFWEKTFAEHAKESYYLCN